MGRDGGIAVIRQRTVGQLYWWLRYPIESAAYTGKNWRDTANRLRQHSVDLSAAALLDVGCGNQYPYALLAYQVCSFACGLDPFPLRHQSLDWRSAFRSEGLSYNAFRQFARGAYTRRLFYRHLAWAGGLEISRWGVPLVRADASAMPFAAESFDVVVSRAAFEHMEDVGGAVREIARVLRPGGLAHITIHPFSALSGGHEKEFWGARSHRPAQPWAHLRDKSWTPPFYLNGLRHRDYMQSFERELSIVDCVVESEEGAEYLTPEIRADLSEFTHRELVTKLLTIVARRRP